MSENYQLPFNPIPWGAQPQDLSGDVPDVPYMGLYTAETTQRYIYGTRKLTWDGRVFKYGNSTNIVAATNVGLKFEAETIVIYSALIATPPAGATFAYIDAGGDAAVAEDELAGGYITFGPAAWNVVTTRCITGNSLSDANGYTYVYFERQPLPSATYVRADLHRNPYSQLKYRGAAGNAYGSVAGLPNTITAAINEKLWIQSWGPCWIAPQTPIGAAGLGSHNRQLTFRPDGAIDEHNYNEAYNTKQQHAGFIMSYSPAGSDGPPLIMLQISI